MQQEQMQYIVVYFRSRVVTFSQFLLPLAFTAAERLNRLKSHVNPFCMQKMYILNLKKGMNRKIRSSSR